MREKLKNLFDKTIIHQYTLPNSEKNIDGISLSNQKDDCFDYTNDNDLIELIYNSIIEYSFNEFEMTDQDYDSLLVRALQTKIRYKEWDKPSTKLKYGFFGEVLLYAFLYKFYKTKPLISRGYFFNPLEGSETKGYDSYHLIENDNKVELWFGEVKFRATLWSGAKSAIDGLDKALTDSYLHTNILAMVNQRNNFAESGSKLETILNSWENNPSIKIIDEVKKHNMTLVYPVLLIYFDNDPNYDMRIQNSVDKINKEYKSKTYDLSIEYNLFFIFLPVSEVKKIKEEVLEWIELKKPLL